MRYTEEFLKKNNITSVSMISERGFAFARIIITDVENFKYNYDIKTLRINDNILKLCK
jgi:hypothetical protein